MGVNESFVIRTKDLKNSIIRKHRCSIDQEIGPQRDFSQPKMFSILDISLTSLKYRLDFFLQRLRKMCLDLVTPHQSLIELSACFFIMMYEKKKWGVSCRFESPSSAVLWKWEGANSSSLYVTDLKCQLLVISLQHSRRSICIEESF